MHFCIRDDDTSFFTSPDELEAAYGTVSQQGPISLAIIPYCRAGNSKGVPERFRGRWSIHPLHQNMALVDYLRDRIAAGCFEAMLHGYHHDVPNGPGEFAGRQDLRHYIFDGRRYLEDLLATEIRLFVPPQNAIGAQGLRAVVNARLHLGGTAGIRCGWPLRSPTTWRLWFQLRRWRRNGTVGMPWVLDLGDHREIPGNAVTPTSSMQHNESALMTALCMNGVFCVATHYWELQTPSQNSNTPPVGEQLRRLIAQVTTHPHVQWRSVGETVTNPSLIM
ncbi:MAG: DUF2334 domain-containing protein [Candidatus Binatia bacterium]